MSLISTYQSIKTLLANKLTSKGVTANSNEGLTTLINKIDNIQANGIIIWGNKEIIQSTDDVDINVFVFEDGKPVTGETVHFYAVEEE